ncbi:MAG TPA: methyltransferase domain-containing protein [Saprospiraceae bacterium]|nr:methyltransferase domain-containing protein [Saprospiraceae bacterium]
MRLIQHKKEAWWFYRFLSIFYDKYVNPLFWTARMRDQSLQLAQLSDPNLSVVDVGSGTGFTTQGIVQFVKATHVYCIDQSPHQMAKAKAKSNLSDCNFQIGDAENLPYANDHFDRYVSAGSIEYWPNPDQGIREAYRVIKPGGIALLIGPLEPENRVAKLIADTWMLFPGDGEYRRWFEAAGFTDIRVQYIRPQWYRSKAEYGIAIAGVKRAPGVSPAQMRAIIQPEPEKMTVTRALQVAWRVLIGSLAGFLFIPVALFGYLRRVFAPQENIPEQYRERLNFNQILALIIIAGVLIAGLIRIIF